MTVHSTGQLAEPFGTEEDRPDPDPRTADGRRGGREAADAWKLVRAAQGGDKEAFGRLYARYQPRVERMVRGKVRDPRLAEDLTSETFLRAWRRLDTLTQRRADPGAWLSTIARNLVFDHTRSARTRLERPTDQLPEPSAVEQAGQISRGPEAQMLARADRAAAAAALARCLDRLTPAQRRAVQLYDLQPERSLRAAAAAMGRSESAVRTLRERAMAAVRDQLGAEGLTSSQECADAIAQARAGVQRPRQQRVQRQQPTGMEALAGQARAWQHHHDSTARSAAGSAVAGAGADERPADRTDPAGPSQRRRGREFPARVGGGDDRINDRDHPLDAELGGAPGGGQYPAVGVVDGTAVALARAGAALARMRRARAVAAGGGGESARAERLARWHAEDQAGSEAAGCDDGSLGRCAHLEAAAR